MPDEPNNSPQVPQTPDTTPPSGNDDLPQPMPAVETEPASGVSVPVQAVPVQTFPQQQTQTQAPAQTPFPAAVDTPAEPPVKKSRKKFVIGGIIAAILVLLIGGGVFAYMSYQNPDRVLVDSMVNAMKAKSGVAKGVVSFKSSSVEMNLTMDVKSAEDTSQSVNMQLSLKSTQLGLGSKEIDFKADTVTDKDGNLYFKLKNVKEVAEVAVDGYIRIVGSASQAGGRQLTPAQLSAAKAQLMTQLQPIITKLDNKWMKVSTSDYDSFTGKANSRECFKKAIEKLQNDNAVRGELIDLYYKNKFVVVKEQLGVKDGNIGYVLDFDQTKAKAFGDAAESSQFAKDIKACSPGSSTVAPRTQSPTNTSVTSRVEVWISQWSHELKQVKVSVDDQKTSSTMNLDITSDTSVKPQVEIPSDAQSFKEVMAELQQLMMGAGGGATNGGVGSSEAALREAVINQYRANNQGKTPTEAEIQQLLKLYGPTKNS